MEAPNQTPFRIAERKYKRRIPPPDYSDLVDFQKPDANSEIRLVARIPVDQGDIGVFESNWTAYSLDSIPGAILRGILTYLSICMMLTDHDIHN